MVTWVVELNNLATKLNWLLFLAFFVATQFFYTLSFINILVAIILVVMYLLFIQEQYRVVALRWIGIDLAVAGKKNSARQKLTEFRKIFRTDKKTIISLLYSTVFYKVSLWLFNHFVNLFFRCSSGSCANHFWIFGRQRRLHARLRTKLLVMVNRNLKKGFHGSHSYRLIVNLVSHNPCNRIW